MNLLKSEKAAIDSNPYLSPWEKLEKKTMLNTQIVDPIDLKAEKQCDWVDFGCEWMKELIRRTSCNWAEEQQCLRSLHFEVESRKFQIQQQAELGKCIRRVLLG